MIFSNAGTEKPNGGARLVGGLVRKLFALIVVSMLLKAGLDVLNASGVFAVQIPTEWLGTAFVLFSGGYMTLIDPKAIAERISGHLTGAPGGEAAAAESS